MSVEFGDIRIGIGPEDLNKHDRGGSPVPMQQNRTSMLELRASDVSL